MKVVLEAISGPIAGKRITLAFGEVRSFGRTEKADMPLGDDFMSGLHFAVEYGPSGCRVIDKGSRNGTFLNDAKVGEALVAAGDKIRAGQTTFVVQFSRSGGAAVSPPASVSAPQPSAPQIAAPAPPPVPPAPSIAAPASPGVSAPAAPLPPSTPALAAAVPPPPPPQAAPAVPRPVPSLQRRPAALTVGSWSFGRIPEGWQPLEGYGVQQARTNAFQSSVVATEEQLFEGSTLQQFVEAQVTMMRQYLREPHIEAALPPGIPGAEEAVAVDVRYSTREGEGVLYKRVYARAGAAVGVLTLTTLERELQAVLPAFRELIDETSFYPAKSSAA
jgi:hypothetical protein